MPVSPRETTYKQEALHFFWFFAHNNKNNSSTSCQACILGVPAPNACISSNTVAAFSAVLMQPWRGRGWKP